MDNFFAASINPNLPQIDLHGVSNITAALEQLETELFLIFNTGKSACRVVHGIGSGRLFEAVAQTLDKNPLVLDWKKEESGGSSIVLF